jgi:hypothetical protein
MIINNKMNILNHQTFLIKQLFINLDMPDVIKYFDIKTPYNLSYATIEKAPYDIILEESCPYGYKCLYKKTPIFCYKNHQTILKVIKKNEIIPKYLCKYERPWRQLNNKQMRCENINCWFSHLEGRRNNIAIKIIDN